MRDVIHVEREPATGDAASTGSRSHDGAWDGPAIDGDSEAATLRGEVVDMAVEDARAEPLRLAPHAPQQRRSGHAERESRVVARAWDPLCAAGVASDD